MTPFSSRTAAFVFCTLCSFLGVLRVHALEHETAPDVPPVRRPVQSVIFAERPGTPPGPGTAGSISLEEAITRTAEHDPELRYLQELYAIERYRAAAAYRGVFPRVRISYSHSDTVHYNQLDTRVRRAAVGVEQLLYDGGRTRRSFALLRSRRELRRIAVEERKRELETGVTGSYVAVLGLRRQIDIRSRTLALAQAQLEVARRERALERTTGLSIRRIELVVGEQELEIHELQLAHTAALQRFAALLYPPGEVPVRPLYPAGALNLRYNGTLSERTTPQEALRLWSHSRGRTEQLLRLEKGETRDQIARRGVLPRVTADGEVSMSGREFPLDQPGFSLGVRLELSPLWSSTSFRGAVSSPYADARTRAAETELVPGDRLDHRYDRAHARSARREAEARVARFESSSAAGVVHAFDEIAIAREQASLMRRRIALKREGIAIADLRAELGEISRLELLEEIVELTALENELARRLVRLHEREIALLHTVGLDLDQTTAAIIEIRGDA